MLKDKFKFDLQLFADGDPTDPPAEPAPSPEPPEPNPEPPKKTYDEDYVKGLRTEAAGYRTKLKDLEKSMETKQAEFQANLLKALGIEPDPKADLEKQLTAAQTKAQEAEQKANAKLIKAEIKALSTELGLVDAEAVLALIDKSKISIGEDGNVEGAKELVEALVENKPWLKKADPTPKPVGNPTNPPPAKGDKIYTKAELNKMSQDEINKNWPKIQEQLAKGLIK